MNDRQEQLLKLVIENHIATAEPIGSRFLVDKAGLDWSEATVRNDLRSLEDGGYLTHPHTSAGRLPTNLGYRYYVDHLDFDSSSAEKTNEKLFQKAILSDSDYETARKNLAKTLVELSKETVLLAFSPTKVYYTGLANLFKKPELLELNLVADISRMFDHCEECLDDFYDKADRIPKYFIGEEEHPFGGILSVAAMKFGESGLLALLGPKRMNYKKNWVLMNKVKEII